MQRLFSLTTSVLVLAACEQAFEAIGTDAGVGDDEATSEGEEEATTGSGEEETATEDDSSSEGETTTGEDSSSEAETTTEEDSSTEESSGEGVEDERIAEAIADINALTNATISAFLTPDPGWYEDPENVPQHSCPYPWMSPQGGEASITPPLSFDCNNGPDNLCHPTQGAGAPGFYEIGHWTDNPIWAGVSFVKWAPHAFHYNLIVVNGGSETLDYTCSFTVQAFGDLDDDSVFSTYERSGELGLIEGVGLGVISLSELTIIDGDE